MNPSMSPHMSSVMNSSVTLSFGTQHSNWQKKQKRGESMSSDVARWREQYELEYQAAKRGLEGVAIVAPHQFITRRMEQMWEHFQQLAQEVGQSEAHRLVFGEAAPGKERESAVVSATTDHPDQPTR